MLMKVTSVKKDLIMTIVLNMENLNTNLDLNQIMKVVIRVNTIVNNAVEVIKINHILMIIKGIKDIEVGTKVLNKGIKVDIREDIKEGTIDMKEVKVRKVQILL